MRKPVFPTSSRSSPRLGYSRRVLFAAGWFFLLMSSYGILRPIRDDMAIAGGVREIPWLWSATFLVTLAIAPLFAWAVSRWPRRVFVPRTYHLVAGQLVVFFALWETFTDDTWRLWLGRAFYVWVSVYVQFVVSVFWSVLADLFDHQQAKRRFGIIAIGGTLGMMAGSQLTEHLVMPFGASGMLLVSAGLLELGLVCSLLVMRNRAGSDSVAAETPPGKGILHGASQIFRQPYLLAIAGYVFLLTYPPTFLYLEKARLINELFDTREQRIAFFSKIDFWIAVVTLGTQLFLRQIIQGLGVGVTLAILPLLCAVGFIGLGMASMGILPMLATFFAFDVIVSAGRHAIARPTRETLWTLLTREQKYASKNFVDTAVYRGGDVANSFLHRQVSTVLGSASSVAFAAVPMTLAWLGLGFWLGRSRPTGDFHAKT